jgi:hypothetical protein
LEQNKDMITLDNVFELAGAGKELYEGHNSNSDIDTPPED